MMFKLQTKLLTIQYNKKMRHILVHFYFTMDIINLYILCKGCKNRVYNFVNSILYFHLKFQKS